MHDQIELHDSRVRITQSSSTVAFELCPAYVHHWERTAQGWAGEGRTQRTEVIIESARLNSDITRATFQIAGGWIRFGNQVYENLIPASLTAHETVYGRFELVNAANIEFLGMGVTVRLIGCGEFVEVLPAEWAPYDD